MHAGYDKTTPPAALVARFTRGGQPAGIQFAARRGGRFCRLLTALPAVSLLLGWSLPVPSWASCLAVAAPPLEVIDAEIPRQPRTALQAALQQLNADPKPPNAIEAQLYAIVAEARAELDQPELAQAAISAALLRLDRQNADSASNRLRLRLNLLRAELSITTANDGTAGAAIDALLAGLPQQSQERTCALAERAIAYDFAGESDRAVAAALAAYRVATARGWRDARIWSAYTLAGNFQHAGLFDQAQTMMGVVIGLETDDQRVSSLINAEYAQGQLFIASHRFAEAREALQRAQAYAAQTGDRTSIAMSNVPLCWAAINQRDFSAAQAVCYAGQNDLLAGGRRDFAALLMAYQARLDIEQDRPLQALRKLDAIVAQPLHQLLPDKEAQIIRDRGRALASLHRYPQAYAALARANDLDRLADVQQRNRQVAVLSAVLASEEMNSRNSVLETRITHQAQDLATQKVARRLWTLVAVAAGCVSAMLVALLILARLHGRGERRHAAILRSVGARAPDAILLLDEHKRVWFANRNPLGKGPLPAVGQAATQSVPDAIKSVLMLAIDESYDTGAPVERSVECLDCDGEWRQYEIAILPAMEGSSVFGATLRALDVTDIRSLEREVMDSASRERQKLSNEIHEGLGQQLAGVLLMLGHLSSVAKRGYAGVTDLADEIARHLSQSINSARDLAKELAPVTLGRGSISIALQSLVHEAASNLRITVTNECRLGEHVLTDLAADHLYRICREAITSAARHGSCTRISVMLQVVADQLLLRILDDGAEFLHEDAVQRRFSVRLMRYYARLLGGDLEFSRSSEHATLLKMIVPISRVVANLASDAA